MKHREVELLAIGGGPSSLALAVAIEELASENLARSSLVIEQARDAYVPEGFDGIRRQHLIHSTEYLQRVAERPRDVPYRVVVIGGGQSSAEMFDAVQRDLPGCQRTMVMRSIGMKTYE